MRFLLSRLMVLPILASVVYLGYRGFKHFQGHPSLYVYLFLACLIVALALMRGCTEYLFEWGERSRPWDHACRFSVVQGIAICVVCLWLSLHILTP